MKKIFGILCLLVYIQYGFAQVSYYKGEWTRVNKQELFTGIFKISKNATNNVKVEIVWTYLAIDSSNSELLNMYKGKKGKAGIEYAEGSFSEATGDFTFEGLKANDPFVILGLDKYHLKLSADKKVIYGTSETQGSNEGLLYGVKLTDAAGQKEFVTAKAGLKK